MEATVEIAGHELVVATEERGVSEDTWPCQLCMGECGRSAQMVLADGQWLAWPLVAARNDDWPVVRVFCPECSPDEYAADIPRINAAIAQRNVQEPQP